MNAPVLTYGNPIAISGRHLMRVAFCIVLALPMAVQAATWSGVNFTWSQPDSDSFDVPYNSGDAAVFAGAGLGTIAVAAGGVDPGSIAINENGYTFALGENDALGTATITYAYGKSLTFTNTLGSAINLANSMSNPNGGDLLTFAGGDFVFTGTVNGGGNGGPVFDPVAGVTVTISNGITGGFFARGYALGTLKILAASTGKLGGWDGGTIEVWHDLALGPGNDQFSTRPVGCTLIAGGGARTLAQNIYARSMTVDGTNDLTLNGVIVGGDAYTFTKNGTGMLTLNGTNGTWCDNIVINAGTLVAGQTNALGGAGAITVNNNGMLAIGPGVDFTRTVTFNAGSALGGSGSFTRGAAWSLPSTFTVRPGISATPGTLTVNTAGGGMTFGDGRTLEIDFSGTNADRLVLDGALTLSGTTDKLLLRGTAKPGTYVIASAASVNGVFNQEDITGLVYTRGRVIYLADQVLFHVLAPGTVVVVQ